MIWINGNEVAKTLTIKLKKEVSRLSFQPLLSIVQVGDNLASTKYISYKIKKAQELNIITRVIKLPLDIDEKSLISIVKDNAAKSHGLIVQLPLPNHIVKQNVLNAVPFAKDIDGLAENNHLMIPATPQAIIQLLNAYNFTIKNKIVAVIGQSNLVGKPTANLCEKLGAKQVYRLDQTTSLDKAKLADIVIVAIGKPKFIKADNLKSNAIVIDVGINEIADANSMRKIVGDVDAHDVQTKVKALSLVPGGVGPMTIMALLTNLVQTCQHQDNSQMSSNQSKG